MTSFNHNKRGFTLIEMIVSVGLFTIVLFIASSSFLSVVNADRKSRATRLAMDNLTVAMEDMTRRMKTGYSYMCEGGVASATSDVSDCTSPKDSIAFTDQDGNRVAYRLHNNRIYRGIKNSAGVLVSSNIPVTAPEITIEALSFDVHGSAPLDNVQPYVQIFINGKTDGGVIDSSFKLQTMVTQRVYDI
jgi:prepilin-type N-terminal cleavage/methylation domain-containing protein